MFTTLSPFSRNFAPRNGLVRRMVDERIAELQPMIEELVEKRIAQKLKQNENRK